MKIVYLASSIIPSRTANSIHVMKMCQALVNNNHDITLIVPDKKEEMEAGVDDIYDYYGVNNCFKVIKLPWLRYLKGRGYIYGLQAAGKARYIQPELVYSRYIPACYFATRLGLETIFEAHQPPVDSGKISEWMFRRLIKQKNFRKIVVITSALKKYYQNNFSNFGGEIQVAPDGADLILSEALEPVDLHRPEGRLQVGYVGHLYKGKGMEVISELAPLCPWADFHIVGGRDKDILYWKEECHDCNNIFFHGYFPQTKIASYLKRFNVVLLPNQAFVAIHGRGDKSISRWTSPLKAFEYMAAGKPIISSDLPVLREVLKDKHNALLCPPGDVPRWQKALEELRDNPELRNQLAKTAYNEFVENYTWESRAKKILNFYSDV